MSFSQWHAMPSHERKHRVLLFIADIEAKNDANAQWVETPEDE